MISRLTIALSKLAGSTSRLLRRGGGDSLPGMVAERCDPRLAARLAAQLPNGVIIVTGTNGKTTTTKLLGEMLTAAGERIVTNPTGSNLKQGIVTALIAGCDLRGRLRGNPTIGLFEVDEAALASVTAVVGARHILVTNLFRDQLDRYGELESTALLIGQGIQGTGARIFLNADDPMVVSLARYVPPGDVTYFGVQRGPKGDPVRYRTVSDSDRCPVCDDALTFTLTFYGHIGHYHCDRGHFVRPEPSVAVCDVVRADADGSAFDVSIDGVVHRAEMPLGGLYNVYNAVAALAVATHVGVPPATASRSLTSATPALGRLERFTGRNGDLLMILVKNPAGFTQVLETFLAGQDRPKILIGINDLAADGRDVSWLWDVPFEHLVDSNPYIVVCGTRAADMALRLHYAGVQAIVAPSLHAGLTALRAGLTAGETGYVLPTYTAMVQLRRELAHLGKVDITAA
jgi:UDP-N-acetylmuramyl tripeptide synthase